MEIIWQDIVKLLSDMGAILRVPAPFVIVEFVGTLAFAISGIRLASSKNFDWFGAYVVGMATAIGGGTMRDLMLGIPPFWLTNSVYFWCCALSLLLTIVFKKQIVHTRYTLFVFDTIGLALFNVIGIEKTLTMGFPGWTAIIMGCITGAGGGVIRDVLLREIPLIFRSEIYAMACIVGGIAYVFIRDLGGTAELSAMISIIVVIVTRVLAVRYKWQLPVLKGDGGEGL